MEIKPKTVANSECIMNEIVLPNDTNNLGHLMGGRLLYLMDVCAAIASARHTNRVCVTAAVDSVDFHSPIRTGEVVTLISRVNRVFRTSMEVEIDVWAENTIERTRRKSNRAFYTFVAVDANNKPTEVPPVIPETEAQKRCYVNAERRREMRLLLAGRIKLADAPALKEEFLMILRGEREQNKSMK